MVDGVVGANGLAALAEVSDTFVDLNGLAHESGIFALADTDIDTAPDPSLAAPLSIDFDYRDDSLDMVAEVLLAKSVSVPVSLGDGTFSLSWTVAAQASGNERLVNVQIVDDLSSAFPAGFVISNLSSPEFAVNPAFDGVTVTELLAAGNTLELGSSKSVSFDVQWTPTSTAGVTNQASVTGAGEILSGPASADSTVGTDPTNLSNSSGPTTSNSPTILAELQLSKSASVPVYEGAGLFSLDWTLAVANSGVDVLDGVQITDDLAANFPDGYSVAVSSATLALNTGFDGDTDQLLLAGTDGLDLGESASVVVSVTWRPSSVLGVQNRATATASGVLSSTPVTVLSSEGVDPSNPANAFAATSSVPAAITPTIAIAEAVLSPPPEVVDGRVTATLQITVANLGSERLTGVQLFNPLTSLGSGVIVDSADSTTLTVDPSFDGTGLGTLLVGSDELAIGETGVVTITASWVAGTEAMTQAQASALGDVTAQTTTDDSTPGHDPDPNGDGDPAESGPTVVPLPDVVVPETVALAASIVIESVVPLGNGSVALTYLASVENGGSVVLGGVQIRDDAQQVGQLVSVEVFESSTNLTPSTAFDG